MYYVYVNTHAYSICNKYLHVVIYKLYYIYKYLIYKHIILKNIHACVFSVYLYLHKTYTQILCKQNILFWMQLII